MKQSRISAFVTAALVIGSLNMQSCKKSSAGSKNISRATGWKINAKEGGFQYNSDFKEQETAPGLVFIEGGTFTKGKVHCVGKNAALGDYGNVIILITTM